MSTNFRSVIIIELSIIAVVLFSGCNKQMVRQAVPTDSLFVPVEEAPIQVKSVTPDYPTEAANEGIEGTVWVKALIDKTGTVIDAIIFKDSGKGAGFEEAALNAAYKTKWKPAKSDGKPIAVWVTYKLDFNIK